MRANSSVLCVTSVAPCANAVLAIRVSSGPMFAPILSRSNRTLAARSAARRSSGRTVSTESSRFSSCRRCSGSRDRAVQLLSLCVGPMSFSQLLRIWKVLVPPTTEQGENIGGPLTARPLPDRLCYPLAGRLPRSLRVALDQLLALVVQVDCDLSHIMPNDTSSRAPHPGHRLTNTPKSYKTLINSAGSSLTPRASGVHSG